MRNKVFGNILMSLRTMGYSINKLEYAASDKKSFTNIHLICILNYYTVKHYS